MGSSHIDLSNENMTLGGLWKSVLTVGAVLAGLGLVATIALALISGGDHHDDGHGEKGAKAHSTEHADDHGPSDFVWSPNSCTIIAGCCAKICDNWPCWG